MDSSEVKESLIENFDEEFGTLSGRVYLDHAGATVYSRSQMEAVRRDLDRSLYGNPHTRSPASRASSDAIDQARFRLLQHFHTSSDQYCVLFTSGATAALALLADAFQFGGDAASPGAFVYLQESHTSVLGMRGRLAGRPVSVTALPAATAASHLDPGDDDGDGGGERSDTDPADRDGEGLQSDDGAERQPRRGLFAFPAQCNFSGVKYGLQWVSAARRGALDSLLSDGGGEAVRGPPPSPGCRWYCLLDAASYAATCDLDLSRTQPDFVCVSFYKMFGYPTGLGALLVHRRAEHTLQKAYFGGGTVQVSLASEDFHVPRTALEERMEDGTVPFLAIAAVTHGLDTLRRLAGPMTAISDHVFSLARYTYCHLSALRHGNGSAVVRLYSDTAYNDPATQGGIVSFNLLRPDGEFYGSTEVEKFAEVYDIDLRTGCFCNPGACQRHLRLSTDTIRQHFKAGHVCGDETDLIAGRPTGAVRVSFGYMSRRRDADRLLLMVRQCFVSAETRSEEAGERLRRAQQRRSNTAAAAASAASAASAAAATTTAAAGTTTAAAVTTTAAAATTTAAAVTTTAAAATTTAAAVTTAAAATAAAATAAADQTQIQSEKGGPTETVSSPERVATEAAEVVSGQPTAVPVVPGPAAAIPSEAAGARLSGLVVFPVKSCCGFSVPWWPLGPRGLLYDRHWMVVTAGGAALTQKRQPALCRVRPEISLHSGQLRLTADGFPPVCVPLWPDPALSQTPLSLCESRVCGDRVGGLDCGDEAADWLRRVLDQDGVRLVRQNPASSRTAKQNGSGGSLSLSNESPYVLVSRSSVAALSQALQERGVDDGVTEDELTDRFRANLVVSGAPAYLEDDMDSITLGDFSLKVLSGCSRCHMVGVDQATGHRSPEPLLTLNATRGRRMPFGVHLGLPAGPPPENVLLRVGQPVSWRLKEDGGSDQQR